MPNLQFDEGGIIGIVLLAMLAFLSISASDVFHKLIQIPVRITKALISGLEGILTTITGASNG